MARCAYSSHEVSQSKQTGTVGVDRIEVQLPGAVARTGVSVGHLFHEEDGEVESGPPAFELADDIRRSQLRRVSLVKETQCKSKKACPEGHVTSVVPRGEVRNGQPDLFHGRSRSQGDDYSRFAALADHLDNYDPDFRRLREFHGSPHFRPVAAYFAALQARDAERILEDRTSRPGSTPIGDSRHRRLRAAWAVQPPARHDPQEEQQRLPARTKSMLSWLASAIFPSRSA